VFQVKRTSRLPVKGRRLVRFGVDLAQMDSDFGLTAAG
jgi:hypothetical protein